MELILDDCPEETVSEATPIATERDRFIAEWRSGVGGSDAGTIAGLNPYKTATELYLEKRGEIELADLSDNQAVYWGTRLEEVIAERYQTVTGRRVRRNRRCLRHRKHPWMIAHLDRDISGGGVLECKCTRFAGENWGPEGSDQVPDSYFLQCQHYMGVTDREWSDLAVLIGGNEFRIYTIQRDEDVIEDLIGLEHDFWMAVMKGAAPAIDPAHDRASEAIKRLYRGTNGETIYLSREIETAHAALQAAKAQVKAAELAEKTLKNTILLAMGEAAAGLLPDGTKYTRKLVDRKAYTVDATTYIDFRYSKKGS